MASSSTWTVFRSVRVSPERKSEEGASASPGASTVPGALPAAGSADPPGAALAGVEPGGSADLRFQNGMALRWILGVPRPWTPPQPRLFEGRPGPHGAACPDPGLSAPGVQGVRVA